MKVMIHVGLDVHNDSIAISLAPSDSIEVRRWGMIGGTHDHVLRFVQQLQKAHPDATLKFCYEAGPRGFPLVRFLRGLGHECIVVCPSRVPRRPGDRVKTDRRDADQLARLHRAGELTGLHVPEPEDEALRDLLRSRDQVRRAQHRARQQLKMFLLRHNIRYTGQSSWTAAHLRYLAKIKMPFPAQQFALQELMNAISEAGERLERFDTELAREVAGWRWEPVVRALMSLRGLARLNAAILVAELGDLQRFTRPQELMSYLGLVPSEHTTGTDRQQGGLTKMGNGFARRALVEAAHHYRVPARLTPHLQKRQWSSRRWRANSRASSGPSRGKSGRTRKKDEEQKLLERRTKDRKTLMTKPARIFLNQGQGPGHGANLRGSLKATVRLTLEPSGKHAPTSDRGRWMTS